MDAPSVTGTRREVDLPDAKNSLKIRLICLIITSVLLGWLATSLLSSVFAHAGRSLRPANPMAGVAAAVAIELLFALSGILAWRGAHLPLAHDGCFIEFWDFRHFNIFELFMSCLGGVMMILGGIMAITGVIDNPLVVIASLPALLGGLWCMYWSPIVVVDTTAKVLVRYPGTALSIFKKTVPFEKIRGWAIVYLMRGSSVNSYFIAAELTSGKRLNVVKRDKSYGIDAVKRELADWSRLTSIQVVTDK